MSLAASAGRGPGTLWSPTHVQVTVLQARGLRAKGPGGTSDAYAVIQVGKEKYATSVSERSLGAPVWREEATFELPPLLASGAAPAAAATLQLTVLHRALLGLDKFLGRAEVDLRELHRDQGRRRKQWYTLRSKPGKKEKERGEIEVDIQFMRNNMTASMFDLSMKDKPRNPFGKLKDKIKGKNKDSLSDTASAIVPSVTPSVDSDDESLSKDKKKKSKIKTLFSKSNLQKTALSQSMSVLPTSKPDKVLLRPGDFQSQWEDDDPEDESSSASDIISHKGAGSADPKQLSQINFSLPKKEGLSFLGGLRSKNDFLSRSNVCINGNHVYMEQPEARSETKDSSPSNSPSPQGFRKKHLFSSTENLAIRSWKEAGEGTSTSQDRRLSETSTKGSPKATDALKSMSLPSYRPPASGDIRENMVPVNLEVARETKESKKPESKKSSLLSLVTGKKDAVKGSEGESPHAVPFKEKEGVLAEAQPREEDLVRRLEKDAAAVASRRGNSLNPFEDVHISEPEAGQESTCEPKPPVPSARAPQTKAVKPRLEVSPEAQPKARFPSSPSSPLPFSALLPSSGQALGLSELGHGSETESSESPSVFSSFSSPIAAPISTSTPIEHWAPTGQGRVSSEEPPLLRKADMQKERSAPVPNTGSSALGSLCKQTPTAVWEKTEDSPRSQSSEADPVREAINEESGKQELQGAPHPEQDCVLCPEEAHTAPFALSLSSATITGPSLKPLARRDTDTEDHSRSLRENRVSGGMTPPAKDLASPLQVEVIALPKDTTTQKHEEMERNASEAPKKVKKRVSFSEQLFTQEEVEKPTGFVAEERRHPQKLACEEAVPGATSGLPHPGDVEKEPADTEDQLRLPSQGESSSQGSMSEASSAEGSLLFQTEGGDPLPAQYQSKASDHEGLLSDPLSGLPSASDVKPPLMADLNVSLPSIPEVASDDERVDEVEGIRKPAKPAVPEVVGASSLGVSSPSPEDGGVLRSSFTESLLDPRPQASKAASVEQTAALGTHKPHFDKGSIVDEQLPGPDAGEETKGKESAGPSPDSPVPSPSLSEPFPAAHSFPRPPHSHTDHTSPAESHKQATAEGSAAKVDNFGKRKPLLQAWVSPSETHPVSAQPSTGTGAAKHRLQPVKPMNTAAIKITNSNLGTATIVSENLINEAMMKKYNPSDPAFAYAQLTHDELIQLVLKQKETISKKEFQVRELEDYIDNLLVRVMEETPNILRVPAQVGKKAGKM
ncbi:rab11 family-interacting protein 1 isoform X1 [Perognathus longimembris pacificus]|uniref:rab11 family-interacting protein 1 isoform X1 n=1 Tax=Perognathus longimembris pacificus TaxID=214514 RepID=UPI002019B54C|nr:rab11 family-interacting protein 1 isoform X1 [Perognathus longimembris pacificus]